MAANPLLTATSFKASLGPPRFQPRAPHSLKTESKSHAIAKRYSMFATSIHALNKVEMVNKNKSTICTINIYIQLQKKNYAFL